MTRPVRQRDSGKKELQKIEKTKENWTGKRDFGVKLLSLQGRR